MKSPKEITSFVSDLGVKKAEMPVARMLAMGFLAGMFVALAGAAANTGSAMMTNAGVGKIISALIFPAGLTMVLCAGSELFTGNCLMGIALLDKKISLWRMLKNWIFVYIGNFVGSVFVAALTVFSGQTALFGGQVAVTTVTVAANKCGLNFFKAVALGVLCNILVCVAVWISFGANTVGSKIAGLFFPVFVFVLCGFEHSIANMFYVPAGLFAASSLTDIQSAAISNLSQLTWANFLLNNLLPVTIGNIIGGFGLGALYCGIFPKKKERKQ